MNPLMKSTSAPTSKEEIQISTYKLASPFVLALKECDPELREMAWELFEQLHSGALDPEQAAATTALIAEILFPNADGRGAPGLDLEEAEKIAVLIEPASGPLIQGMDKQEATFAERLRQVLEEKGVTQADLALKIGIGQPAISMMLNRTCRPQQKTVAKIATALDISPVDLWPIE
ncbi:dna-binding protein : Protein containing Helix-turn-helix type 3 domain protein OS=Rhodopirellula baltica SWK14 GN=RBSWK_02058 PE=4 SV=1: HTH_3 [Gemmata massiliana]|uniref:HTH cro/C1-type domain-containing protein n=1 Tax=Gemmata massiliana TaxID=1210884 RepID=A0A6P2CPS2_9BACT|nr:helix-turn-helix transcriptional regulator [Gemmata massiliana]VTR90829.1 dna-binding protein : Protein containing Helix-turn-helix type 3 domain protein OS=Rhodopirellula baltica SWK14 GN=RBSWK_02058 PE=4 SV=1: HTH_3 [Gemmata massiliana]